MPRNCSGLFSKEGLESLKGFMDYRSIIINPIKGADIYLADEKFSVRRNEAVAFVCDRVAMDQALARHAEDEGARMHYGERISDLSAFRSGNIIGADGPLSYVAKAFRFPLIRRYVSTLQAIIPYRSKDPNCLEMHISNERFPGFFAWVLPHDEQTAEFGVGVLAPHSAPAAWKRLLKQKRIGAAPAPKGFLIPLRDRQKTAGRYCERNVLLVGDAAGQVKSTTGGGVIFGGNCAAIAGRFVSNPLGYELAWRARFGADLAMHAMLHHYLSSRTDSQLSAFGRRIKKTNLDEYLERHGHKDKPTRMVGMAAVLHILKNMGGLI
jgi:flavin-dependent dehydrogenase